MELCFGMVPRPWQATWARVRFGPLSCCSGLQTEAGRAKYKSARVRQPAILYRVGVGPLSARMPSETDRATRACKLIWTDVIINDVRWRSRSHPTASRPGQSKARIGFAQRRLSNLSGPHKKQTRGAHAASKFEYNLRWAVTATHVFRSGSRNPRLQNNIDRFIYRWRSVAIPIAFDIKPNKPALISDRVAHKRYVRSAAARTFEIKAWIETCCASVWRPFREVLGTWSGVIMRWCLRVIIEVCMELCFGTVSRPWRKALEQKPRVICSRRLAIAREL